MDNLRSCVRLLASAALCAGVAVAAPGQAPFSGPASSIRFTLPDGWKADEQGTAVRISAPDGSAWTLKRSDAVGKEAAGDPTRSAALRDAAEVLAQSIVQGPRYAGVNPLTVTGGSGAVFRFRGQGKRSGDDLAEVWVAVIGGRSAVLVPVAAPQTDHAYELGLLTKSLSLGEAGKPDAGRSDAGKAARSAESPGSPSANSRQATGTPATAETRPNASNADTGSAHPAVELETYEGHVVAGDVGFKLHIFEGTRATAEWDRTVGQSNRYAGTYTGSDGNYAIKLGPSTNTAAQAPLTMTLRSLGGMVRATYVEGSGAAQRDVAELKLTGVYTPTAKLRGTGAASQNANRGRNTNQRRSTGNRGNTRNRNRGRRIIIPGIGNPIRP